MNCQQFKFKWSNAQIMVVNAKLTYFNKSECFRLYLYTLCTKHQYVFHLNSCIVFIWIPVRNGQLLCFILLHASPKYRSVGSSVDNYVKSNKTHMWLKYCWVWQTIQMIQMILLFTHKSVHIPFQGHAPAKVWARFKKTYGKLSNYKIFTAASSIA